MGRSYDSHKSFKGTAHKGLLRLMMKLPSLRERLQLLATRSRTLENYCDAYGEATAMLERLESGQAIAGEGTIEEYRAICSEIETDVVQYCRTHT